MFGERVRELRKARKLSQQATAVRAGMSLRNFQKIESGTQDPKLSSVLGLAEALRVTPAKLITFNGKGKSR